MTPHISWELEEDISPQAWLKIQKDFDLIARAYPQKIKEDFEDQKAKASFLKRLVRFSLPDPIFEVQQNSDDRLIVAPGVGRHGFKLVTAENQTQTTWILDRKQSDKCFLTQDQLHTELLLATLMLVEKHAPGQLYTTHDYNYYDRSMLLNVQKWVLDKTKIDLPGLNPLYVHTHDDPAAGISDADGFVYLGKRRVHISQDPLAGMQDENGLVYMTEKSQNRAFKKKTP